MDFSSQILQYVITGITVGSIYALMALGFNIIYSATDIINFAQGEFVMYGGMIMITLVHTRGLPLPVAFVATVAAVSIIGMLLEVVSTYQGRQVLLISRIMVTIGASILLKGLAMFIWGKDTFALRSFSGDVPFDLMGASVIPQVLWVVGVTAAVVTGMGLFFGFTFTGKAMRACAINPTAAGLVGIRIGRMYLLSYALSASLGAVGGIIVAPITMMEYGRGTLLAIKGFAAAVLGGLGSGIGAVAAGFIIGLVESFGAGLISSGYKDALALIILLAILVTRPQGLLGHSVDTRP
jgi:branched-chain amino acid transport system permease protein